MTASPRPLLYDADGKVVRRVSSSNWDASATRGRRAVNWSPSNLSVNSLLTGDAVTLRSRSRDEVRRNPWAAQALGAFVSNVVGSGIRPKPRVDDEREEYGREVKEAWDEWVDECDADGTSDFYGLESLVCRAFQEGGDALVRFRPRRPSDGLSVPLQLQVLEAEMLDYTKNETISPGRMVQAGIEFDVLGRRRGYWIFRRHPGESLHLGGVASTESVFVPADQVVHVFQVLRPGQIRGIPGLASVLARLHEIREVDDGYVLRTKIQNLYATFEEVPSLEAGSILDTDGDPTDDEEIPTVTAGPGSHAVLPPGHEIKFGNPPKDAGDYSSFVKTQLHAIAMGAGSTYEDVTGDLEGVNFSSIRAGLIRYRRAIDQVQRNVLVFQLCRPVWRRWLETALLAGRISAPKTPRELARLLRAEWQPPGWEYVEPEKDVRAAVRRIRAGLSSPTKEAAKLGCDLDEILAQTAKDFKRARDLGLMLDSDPANGPELSDQGADPAGEDGETGEEGNSNVNAA